MLQKILLRLSRKAGLNDMNDWGKRCKGSYQTDRFVEGNIFDNPELLKGDQSCTDL